MTRKMPGALGLTAAGIGVAASANAGVVLAICCVTVGNAVTTIGIAVAAGISNGIPSIVIVQPDTPTRKRSIEIRNVLDLTNLTPAGISRSQMRSVNTSIISLAPLFVDV